MENSGGAGVGCGAVVHGLCVGMGGADGNWWYCGVGCGEEGLCDGSQVSVWVENDGD